MNSLKLAACVALVFFTTISAQALTIPSEESGAHEIFCRENNTERGVLNKNHFEFCMEKQHKSYIDIVNIANRYKNENWAQAAIDWSLTAHSERGHRDEWSAWASFHQITEGFEDIAYQAKQPKFNKGKYELCRGRWGFHLNMVVSCYKQDNPDWVP